MSLDPAAQARALGICLAAGVLLGLYYDLLRPLRLRPLPRLLGGLADLTFWAAAALLLFVCALLLGDGRVRLYMAAGVLDQPITHQEVLDTGRRIQANFRTLIDRIIEKI